MGQFISMKRNLKNMEDIISIRLKEKKKRSYINVSIFLKMKE